MTQAMKVYQIAEALGMDYDTVVAKIRAFGIPVNNKMSKVDGDVAEQIKSSLLKDKQQDWVEVQLPNGVIKRMKKSVVAPPPVAAPPPAVARAAEPARPTAREESPPPPRAAEPVREPAPPSAEPPIVEAAPPAPVVVPTVAAKPIVEPVEAARAPAPVVSHAAPSAPVPASEPASASVVEPVREAKRPAAPPRETPPAPAENPVVAAPTPSAAREPVREPAREPVRDTAPAPEPVRVEREPAPAPEPVRVEREPVREAPPEPVREATPPPTAARPEAPSRPSVVEAAPAPEPAAPEVARPSVPPAAKTGVAHWDPITKAITYVQSNMPSRTRSVQVEQSRITPQQRGPIRTLPGQRPGAGRPMMGPGGRRIMARPGPKGPAPTPTQMGAHKRVVKIEGQISLQELARAMAVKAGDVLFKLIAMGMTGVNINTTLDSDTAKLVAQEFQYEVEDVAVSEDAGLKAILPDYKESDADYEIRPPVVTVMGHVDHGKTTLLDAILGMRVAEGEAGGITQKVSAYRVQTAKGPVVFFDTPGHEDFTKLRARGAETTDVAVLVVAADDGVMPTTIEAINHVKAAGVPIVVAMNKMDKPDAKPEKVLQQLMTYDVIPEQFGGDTIVVEVSAKQRTGIDKLLESLAVQSEILELRANPKRPGVGTVYDAALDKGRGVVARVLVQDGTIRTGDVVLAGTSYGKIRAMFDDRGKAITKAGPSTPVEILGLNEVPGAGDAIYVVADIKKAQGFAAERAIKSTPKAVLNQGFGSFEDIQKHLAAGETITIGIIIKAEAQASVEALSKSLLKLSTDKVKIQMVHTGIGGITESDVNLAVAAKSVIIGFNVRPQGKSAALAESEKIQVRLYSIIYEAVDEMKALMLGQLKPTFIEKSLGKAEVRQVFNITRAGKVTIAGCYVTDGLIRRSAKARLLRDAAQLWEGKLASLKRFKEDAKEVGTGYECGIGLEGYSDLKPGDIIEAYELEEVAAKL